MSDHTVSKLQSNSIRNRCIKMAYIPILNSLQLRLLQRSRPLHPHSLPSPLDLITRQPHTIILNRSHIHQIEFIPRESERIAILGGTKDGSIENKGEYQDQDEINVELSSGRKDKQNQS